MRTPSYEWWDSGSVVPLTGREPVTGLLRNRFHARGPGWGWTTLTGPSRSGVSRMLDEAAALLAEEGLPSPLRLGPAPPGAPVGSALRTALVGGLGDAGRRALRRSCDALLGRRGPEDRAALAWLLDAGCALDAPPPAPEALRRVLETSAVGGVVVVDDLHGLDDLTLRVLEPSEARRGFGVLAGTTAPATEARGQVVALEPLSEAQVHLLLKRWLHHIGTARRLAPVLWSAAAGWPGRIVDQVRALASGGWLVASPRGVRLAGRLPSPLPGPEPAPSAGRREDSPAAQQVLRAAAMEQGDPDPAILAHAVGVKRAYVEEVLRRARAAGGPTEAAGGSPAGDGVDAAALSRRLAEAWAAAPPVEGEGAARAARRVRALLRAPGAPGLVGAALELAERLRGCGPRRGRLLDLLRDAQRESLGGEPAEGEEGPRRRLALATADRLLEAGRPAEALVLLRRAVRALGLAPRGPAVAWRRARVARLAGRPRRTIALLGRALRGPAREDGGEDLAFALRAELALAAAEERGGLAPSPREAWRDAVRHVAPADLEGRALAHRGLALAALGAGRRRAAAAHLRRALRLLQARPADAVDGRALLELGRSLGALGDRTSAADALARAHAAARPRGDGAGEAEVLLEMARAAARHEEYDAAVGHLEEASAALARDRAPAPLAHDVHLALAEALEACGETAAARRHAHLAAGDASPPPHRLRSALLLARTAARAGDPAAAEALARVAPELRGAGLRREAERARRAQADLLLRGGDHPAAAATLAAAPEDPEGRLLAARIAMLAGRVEEGRCAFERAASEVGAPVHVRAEAGARLAAAWVRLGRPREAWRAAIGAASLLAVPRRSRAEDARVHRILAVVFGALAEGSRALPHRAEARRLRRRLLRALGTSERAPGPRPVPLLDPAPGRERGLVRTS